jgi:hypothetical protein
MAYPLAEQKALQEQKVPHSNIDTYIALNDLKNLTMYGFDNSNTSSYLEDYTDYIKALGDIDIDVVLSEFKKDAPDSIRTELSGKTTGYFWPSKNELVLSGRGITKNPHHSILPHEVSHVLTDVDKIFGDTWAGDEIYARREFKDLESSLGNMLNKLTEKTGELYEDVYGVWGARSKKGKEWTGSGFDREVSSQGAEFLAEYLSRGKDWKEGVIEKTREDVFEIPYKGMSRGERFSSFPADITDIVKLIEAFENAEKMKAISKKHGNFPDELWELLEGSER